MQHTGLAEFTQALASKTSVPGGGGASALVGAVGIALGDMVGEFTVGKKKYAAVEPEIRDFMARAQALREKLLACIDKDAEAFEPLSKAYGIPKDDPNRAEVMEKCLHDAAAVPMEILDLCAESIGLLKEFADKGSVIVISDAATGAVFARAAMYGAAVNVRINTKSMQDKAHAQALDAHVDEVLSVYGPMAQEVYESVCRRITG